MATQDTTSRSNTHLSFTPSGIVLAFVAGAISVLVSQLGWFALANRLGVFQFPIYPMAPTWPFGVPQTLSFAFWGGLWGIVMLPFLRAMGSGSIYWIGAFLFGAIIVTAVLVFVVFPLKGRPFAAGWNPTTLGHLALAHGIFALGTALLIRIFSRFGR